MKKFLLIFFILFSPLVLFGCSKKETSEKTTNTLITNQTAVNQAVASPNVKNQNVLIEPTLFVSSTCGHCTNVKKFISDNDITNKVQFVEKEVSENQENYDTWLQAGKSCGISEKLGVPLLLDNGRCYFGEVEVIDYFKQKAGIK